MRDLGDLEALVRDPDSRPHFREAVRALGAGAYRAAVVATWVAVAIDLANKIRHVAETGDGIALAKVQQLDQAIEHSDVAAMQKFEQTLLDESERKFELITARERDELKRLYVDRNLCAHPAFVRPGEVFSPSAELVRAHLAAAVDHALALPPVSGKRILENLKRDLDSNSWPDESIVDFLRHNYFTRARGSVRRNLAEFVLKGAVKPPPSTELDVVAPNLLARRCREGLNAINEFDSELLESAITGVIQKWEGAGSLTDDVLLRLTGALGHIPVFWRVAGAGITARMVALLDRAAADVLIRERVFSSGPPADSNVAEAYENAVQCATDDFGDLELLVRRGSLVQSQWVPPALEALREAPSFRSGERRLRTLLKLADSLTEPDLRHAATSIQENNQIYQASDTPQLLLNLYRETSHIPGASTIWQELAQGLHEDYMADHDDADGYYSYTELLEEASESSPVPSIH